jgi:hypothetical protein
MKFKFAPVIAARSSFPTCVQQINNPVYQGRPNPAHGKFFFVGSIPSACYDHENRRSLKYDTEDEAITAAIKGGADRIQRTDYTFVDIASFALVA